VNPEQALWAVSVGLVAASALGLWLLRPDGWLTHRLDAAYDRPLP
jgi:hypothetical protein